jgi:hypothetical protein
MVHSDSERRRLDHNPEKGGTTIKGLFRGNRISSYCKSGNWTRLNRTCMEFANIQFSLSEDMVEILKEIRLQGAGATQLQELNAIASNAP